MGVGLDAVLRAPIDARGYEDEATPLLAARVVGDDFDRVRLTPAGFMFGDGTEEPTAATPADPAIYAEAVWHVDARRNGANEAMRDLVGAVVSASPEPNPKIVRDGAFAGVAAIGRLALTGGTTETEWMTDVDVRWRCAVLPHHDNDDGTDWVEVLNIPNAGDGGITDWGEAAMLLRDDGTIGVAYDMDSSASDPDRWQPETADVDLGAWSAGLVVHDYRLTIVAATGVSTLYQDDEVVFSETIGEVAFDEPPDESEVLVGPANTGLLAIYSVTLLDGIDGDPIITFDATDPTGWTAHSTGGAVTTAPSRAAWHGQSGGGHTFADVGTIGATDSATIVVHHRPLGVIQGGWLALDLIGLFGGGAGWAFLNAPGFTIDNQFRISDGTNTVSASFGTLDQGADVVHVAVLDRDADEVRTYVDGVLVDTADASSLGAVEPSVALDVFGANCWGYAAAIFDRALTDEEIETL